MNNPWLFRLSLLASLAGIFTLLMGAVTTDQFATAPAIAPVSAAFAIHRHLGETFGLLILIVAGWASFGGSNQPMAKKLSWAAVAGVIAEALLGNAGAPLSHNAAFVHAFLGQFVFGTIIAVTVLVGPSWNRQATPLVDKGFPSLRGLSRFTIILFVIQIILGAAFRHGILGVLWHILGAFLVVLFGVGIMVLLTQTQGGQPLRPAVITLGVLLGIQVTLGMILISISDQTKHPALVLYSTVSHAITGAITFGVMILTTMVIWRNVRAAGN